MSEETRTPLYRRLFSPKPTSSTGSNLSKSGAYAQAKPSAPAPAPEAQPTAAAPLPAPTNPHRPSPPQPSSGPAPSSASVSGASTARVGLSAGRGLARTSVPTLAHAPGTTPFFPDAPKPVVVMTNDVYHPWSFSVTKDGIDGRQVPRAASRPDAPSASASPPRGPSPVPPTP